MKKILGLDLSLTTTGVCYPGGDTEVIKPKTNGAERLIHLRDAVRYRCYVKPSDQPVGLVVVEGYSFESKGRATFSTGELGGIIRVLLTELEIPYAVVPPSNLKQYATGKGNCSKDHMVSAATHRAGREFRDNNETDAWWLWQMGLAWYDPDNALYVQMPQHNHKALEKVEWPDE